MIEHISLRCRDSRASRKFYERALEPLGYEMDRRYGDAFGFIQGGGHDFWVTKGKVGTPTHVAFHARTPPRSTPSTGRPLPREARTTARRGSARTTATPPSSSTRTATTWKP